MSGGLFTSVVFRQDLIGAEMNYYSRNENILSVYAIFDSIPLAFVMFYMLSKLYPRAFIFSFDKTNCNTFRDVFNMFFGVTLFGKCKVCFLATLTFFSELIFHIFFLFSSSGNSRGCGWYFALRA